MFEGIHIPSDFLIQKKTHIVKFVCRIIYDLDANCFVFQISKFGGIEGIQVAMGPYLSPMKPICSAVVIFTNCLKQMLIQPSN